MKLGMSERSCFGIGVQGAAWAVQTEEGATNPARGQIRTQAFT